MATRSVRISRGHCPGDRPCPVDVAVSLFAQDDSSLFFDTVDVNVVNVEVVVTDKDGNPATRFDPRRF